MSEVTSSESFIYNTELGTMVIEVSEVKGYDIEDLVRDRAFSQAQILKFEAIAANLDPNAPTVPRTIKSSYVARS